MEKMRKMIYFNKLFKLPGPKDLGMSSSNNSMPWRLFNDNQTEPDWDDYEEYLAKMYPVRYFLAATLPYFFVRIWWRLSRPFKDVKYWLVSHTIRQYHWLDLRQPKSVPNAYRYGWCDTDHRIELAITNLFIEFVETELPHSYSFPSEEEAAKDDGVNCNYAGLKRQLEDHKEIMSIYNWLTKERQQEDAEYDRKLTEWSNALHAKSDNKKDLWKELNTLEARNYSNFEKILERIMIIRHRLWT
jgi:hypothetical protein